MYMKIGFLKKGWLGLVTGVTAFRLERKWQMTKGDFTAIMLGVLKSPYKGHNTRQVTMGGFD